MQIHYATEVISVNVYLSSQYGYPNERNFIINLSYTRVKKLLG